MPVNEDNLDEKEEKKLKEFTICHDRNGGDNDRPRSNAYARRGNRDDRPSPAREMSSADRTHSNSFSRTRFNLDNDNRTPINHSRSAMTNRHLDDKRRVRHRSLQYDNSSEDDRSVCSDNSHRNSRRTRVRYDPDIEDSSGHRIIMGGVLRK